MPGDDPTTTEPTESADPLTRWQRLGSSVIGVGLAGAGAASVFTTQNQAGSVALLAVGGAFLLTAVSGLPIHGAKIKDWEFRMAVVRRQVVERARSGPPEQAQAMLEILKALDPAADHDPAVAALEITVFENEVVAAVEAVRAEGEQVSRHPDAGLGEPLAVLTTQPASIRIGVFAAYAGNPTGRISRTSRDTFVRRAREVGCSGFIFVNGTLHEDDLSYLADRIEDGGGPPVDTVTRTSAAVGDDLRPAIDRIVQRVTAGREDSAPQ
jgi:hypothetical protein